MTTGEREGAQYPLLSWRQTRGKRGKTNVVHVTVPAKIRRQVRTEMYDHVCSCASSVRHVPMYATLFKSAQSIANTLGLCLFYTFSVGRKIARNEP